mmetsp:Transcript_10982/g.33687  ORF Transcript_10982/g.33687 Transcript_10982/m.33687 type:complete len:409 (+) Transcript_10982:86-1312(+)
MRPIHHESVKLVGCSLQRRSWSNEAGFVGASSPLGRWVKLAVKTGLCRYSSYGRLRVAVSSVQSPEKGSKNVQLLDETDNGEGAGAQRRRGLRSVNRTVPFLLLNLVTVIWGSQHAVIKQTVDASGMSPDVMNFSRFLVAAGILTPFLLSSGKREESRESRKSSGRKQTSLASLKSGAELGFWMFAGYALQSLGLLTTTAGKSAFLLYLNVKIVPFLAATLYKRKVERMTWISAGIAVLGTTLLCSDGGQPPSAGDFLSMGAAACSAMYILRLETAAKNHRAADLSVFSLWTTVFLCGSWTVLNTHPDSIGDILPAASQLPAIAYLGVVTTALTTMLQTIGQRFVRAERAAIIYALDPVYAALFSYLLIGEELGETGIVGAGLITFGALINQKEIVRSLRKLLRAEAV